MAADTVHFNPSHYPVMGCKSLLSGGCAFPCSPPDGVEHPVAYASRMFSPVERNYSQIDKEALAVAWGV